MIEAARNFDTIVTHPIRDEAFDAKWFEEPAQYAGPNISATGLIVPGFEESFETRVLPKIDASRTDGLCIVGAPGLSKGTSELEPYYRAAEQFGIPMIGVIPQSHQGSPDSKNGLATYGQGGSPEIVAAMDFAEREGLGYRFIGVGVSHGAAVVAAAGMADRRNGNRRIEAYSFMAPAFSPRRAIRSAAPQKLAGLLADKPRVPRQLPESRALAVVARRVADVGLHRVAKQNGINLREINLERRIANGQLGPEKIQIIHNRDDEVIPIEGSERVHWALGHQVVPEYFPEGGHVDEWNENPTQYLTVVSRFIGGVVGRR